MYKFDVAYWNGLTSSRLLPLNQVEKEKGRDLQSLSHPAQNTLNFDKLIFDSGYDVRFIHLDKMVSLIQDINSMLKIRRQNNIT